MQFCSCLCWPLVVRCGFWCGVVVVERCSTLEVGGCLCGMDDICELEARLLGCVLSWWRWGVVVIVVI